MSDTISKFLLGFVLVILGVILTTVIASQIILKTDFTTIGNEVEAFTSYDDVSINETEVHTLTNAPTGWKVTDCPISSLVIKNASGENGTALTLTTDYVPTLSAGTFLLVNTSTTVAMIGADNNTYADYKYCGDDYLNSSWGRNTLRLTPGFFVLMILLAIIAILYTFIRVYKE